MFSIKRFSISTFLFIFLLTGFSSSSFGISKKQVIRDFKSQYKIPSSRKITKIRYRGFARRFYKWLGGIHVAHKSYKVDVDNYFKDCGLKVRYSWRVWYAKISGRWTFQMIVIDKHKFLNKPKVKTPLTDDKVRSILKKNIHSQDADAWIYRVISSKLLNKKFKKWSFCTPIYSITSKINVLGGEETDSYHNIYSCKAKLDFINKKGNPWITNLKCKDKKGKYTTCVYDRICKITGKKLNAPVAPKWSQKMEREMGNVAFKWFKKSYHFTSLKKTGFSLKQKVGQLRTQKKEILTDWYGQLTVVLPNTSNPAYSMDHSRPQFVNAKFVCNVRVSKKVSNRKWWWETDSLGCAKPGTSNYKDCDDLFTSCKCVGPSKDYCFFLRKEKKGPCGKKACAYSNYSSSTVTKTKVAKATSTKKTVKISAKYKVDCSKSMFKSRNSSGSLIAWGQMYFKRLKNALSSKRNKLYASGIVPACKKTTKYFGAAYCKSKNNAKYNQILKESVMACKVIYKARIEAHCYGNMDSCQKATRGLKYLRSLLK